MDHPRLPYCGRRHREARPGAAAVSTQGLTVAYPSVDTPAIDDMTIEVPAGARVALVGPNGSGKSTLLKAIAGLLEPARGSVSVLGRSSADCHHLIAYLPQRGELDWRFPMTVRRLVLTGRYVHLGWLKRARRQDWAAVDAALERLGMSDLAGRQIGQLSGGQQQRALLARALAQQADVYLLDEPLTAVDQHTRQVMATVLRDLQASGRSVLLATHELGRLDARFDAAVYLAEGRVVASPAEASIAPVQVPGPPWTG